MKLNWKFQGFKPKTLLWEGGYGYFLEQHNRQTTRGASVSSSMTVSTFSTRCTDSNNLSFCKEFIGDYCVVDFCLKCDVKAILTQSITLLNVS